ncbi:MAG: hypothetical protein RML36_07125 [Anaerolineae bacterium]|nr:hypothetical protein [Anaerolineae bacterium]MDW8099241.1 hypothetical protein [Anaerolineae bacterium]
MRKPARLPAFLAYLLPVFGWLYVFLFHRDNQLAIHHAKQSIALALTAVGALVGWMIIAWLISWIPFGAVLAAALFSLVIAVYGLIVVDWLIGMVYALQAKAKPLPVLGRLALRMTRVIERSTGR